MQKIVIDGITIIIKNSVMTQDSHGLVYCTDAEIESEQFNEFINVYSKYCKYGNYFNVDFNGTPFYGRFGNIIYSQQDQFYRLRLFFVEAAGDIDEYYSGFVNSDDVEYLNMSKIIVKQAITINKLIDTLVKTNLIDSNTAKDILEHNKDEISLKRFEMMTKVEDLDKYLTDIHDNMIEVEK